MSKFPAIFNYLQVWHSPSLAKSMTPMRLHRSYGGCHGDITCLDWSADSSWVAVASKDLCARCAMLAYCQSEYILLCFTLAPALKPGFIHLMLSALHERPLPVPWLQIAVLPEELQPSPGGAKGKCQGVETSHQSLLQSSFACLAAGSSLCSPLMGTNLPPLPVTETAPWPLPLQVLFDLSHMLK